MKIKTKVLLLLTFSIFLMSGVFYLSKTVNKETENRIIETLNTELHSLPSDIQNLTIKKKRPFNNDHYIVTFESSKTEILSWAKRNKKIQKSSFMTDGVRHYIYFSKEYHFHISIINTIVKIEVKIF